MQNGEFVRNRRSVWVVPTRPFKGAHFATFPTDLIRTCIAAGCPKGGVVLDSFMGAGTTAVVARDLGCQYIRCGVECGIYQNCRGQDRQNGRCLVFRYCSDGV
jgi:DNA modification methylase